MPLLSITFTVKDFLRRAYFRGDRGVIGGNFEFQDWLHFTVKQLETLKTSGLVVHVGCGVGGGGIIGRFQYLRFRGLISLYIRTLSQSGLVILRFTTLTVVITIFKVTFVKVLNPSIIGL